MKYYISAFVAISAIALPAITQANIVQLIKRNAPDFAIDGGSGAQNGRSVYLYNENDSNVNQLWHEIDRGAGYYSYQKWGSNHCIDAGNGGSKGQKVYLWECNENNQNQQWKKLSTAGGSFRLEKRNASGFSIDGKGGGANRQTFHLWTSSSSNQNQQWVFHYVPPNGWDEEYIIDAYDVEVDEIYDYPGGWRNPYSLLFNEEWHGYGSTGQTIYNKIDLQDGRTMSFERTPLYDNNGDYVAEAWASDIGYVDGEKDGGFPAGGIADIKINGVVTKCVYAWSVNTVEGGRTSGWAPISAFTPAKDIQTIQETIRERIEEIIPPDDGRIYAKKTVVSGGLASEAAEWFIVPDRAASKTQGKAKYYFERDGYLTVMMNIPEGSRQRYGVAHDIAPVGKTFYMDLTEPEVELPIFAPDTSTPSKYTLKMVWGYFVTSAGDRIYSWANRDNLN